VARSPVESLASASQEAGLLLAGVRDDQWDLPTPCADWSVRDVAEHLVGGTRRFARALREGSPTEPPGPAPSASPAEPPAPAPPGPPADPAPGGLAAAYRESAADLLAACAAAGALDRVVTVPFGQVPGVVALHLRLVEALVHGWDVATATGQVARFDDEAVERALDFSRAQLSRIPPGRRPFGPPQPVADDAPVLDRLVARLGRSVPR
jgi:uncharacterized protein (TIGR03086 family)